MPHLTDLLLTYIEEHDIARTALGFAKGEGEGKTSGNKNAEHHRKIAAAILIPDSSGIWKNCEPQALALHIKNRLRKSVYVIGIKGTLLTKHRLKEKVIKWDAELKETGAGLTEDNPDYQNLISKYEGQQADKKTHQIN